jgi:hypothetical protein
MAARSCAALVSGLIAPQSPPVTRHETLWMYMQGGPACSKAICYFYRVDGDLREKVKTIDTKVCPLYLLTGEYDFSCTPRITLAHRSHNPGVEVTIMKESVTSDERESRAVPQVHPAGAGEVC